MASGSGSLALGEDPKNAARQAAVLFMISGVLATMGAVTGPQDARGLLWVGIGDLLTGLVAWFLPWQRWGPNGPLALAVPALGLLAFSTWRFSGFGAGSGPFFVLTLAWVGLHYSARTLLILLPPVTLAYVIPLAIGNPPVIIGRPAAVTLLSGTVLVGTGMAVAFIISGQVAKQRQALALAREMEQWRAALMAALAHDVRLPITSVLFSLEMLEDDWAGMEPDERLDLLETALRQTGRIQRLADGLLDLERIDEEGRLRLDLEQVPLREAVQAAVSFTKAPDAVVDVDPSLVVYADAERLEQIVINLVGNAVRHGRPPVVVSARRMRDGVRLSVRDHGSGVPESFRDRLFDRFSASSSDPGSMGLGLWITRKLAEAHGGRVYYEPGGPGACFVVDLLDHPDLRGGDAGGTASGATVASTDDGASTDGAPVGRRDQGAGGAGSTQGQRSVP